MVRFKLRRAGFAILGVQRENLAVTQPPLVVDGATVEQEEQPIPA
jgi:hypothetical protein